MTFEEIRRELRNKQYRTIYLLQGEETFFIDRLVYYLENEVLTDADKEFNLMVLYGKDTDAETIASTARRYPMMASHQVVIVKEAQQLPDIEKLEKYAQNPMPTTLLVLAYKGKKVRSNSKLAQAIVHHKGVIFDAKKFYESQIPDWIKKYMQAHHCQIEHEAAAMLVEYLGNDLGHIANELDKLLLNIAPNTTVNKQHIADNIGISKEYNVFELQDAVANRQTVRVFKMADYFSANPKAGPLVLLIASLYRFFSKLYIYHHVMRQPEAQIIKAMGLSNAWALKDYKAGVKNFPAHKTRKALELLYTYDLKSKGYNNAPGTTDADLMKELLLQLLYT
ncbi:DNA polymerase III subunit delta [Sphingobacteriales bacterium UPWRP_1]|nr:DNA polymerase III subunit delta [Sphingobacteriales bacterium TSM_CSM]PSJ78073.1 DNA polymerase III subunit delta [Sphingobacteriales bacterium UPWRP_1]